MMIHLCNRCVREFLILARTLITFGLPSKPSVTDYTVVVPDMVPVMCHMAKDLVVEALVPIALADHNFLLMVIATPYGTEDARCFS